MIHNLHEMLEHVNGFVFGNILLYKIGLEVMWKMTVRDRMSREGRVRKKQLQSSQQEPPPLLPPPFLPVLASKFLSGLARFSQHPRQCGFD